MDSSAPALELARRNYVLNGHDPAAHEFVDSDVTRYLQSAADSGETFDIVILDPPAFAKSLSAKEKALRAYERLNTLGAQAVAPGGLLLTCSCSGGVDAAEFESAVRVALARAGRIGADHRIVRPQPGSSDAAGLRRGPLSEGAAAARVLARRM